MKKDVFGVWLRELSSLVLTQSVQAFLLAAVMSVIVSTATGSTAEDQNVAISATGVIAIIALTSISKIEILVKKIFGIESQFGDPSLKSGMGSLASGLLAANLAKRALNNVPKMGRGVRDIAGGAKDRIRAQQKYSKDLNRLIKGGAAPTDITQRNAQISEQSQNPERNTANEEMLNGARRNEQQKYAQNVERQTGGGSSSGNSKDLEKLDKLNERLQEELAAGRKKQMKGAFSLASGAAESGASLLSVGAGMTVGLGLDGSFSSAIKGGAAAIGISDMIAGGAVSGAQMAQEISSGVSESMALRKSAIKETNEASQKAYGSQKEMINHFRSVKQRDKELNDFLIKNMTAGDL